MPLPRRIKVNSKTVVIELDQSTLEDMSTLAMVAERYISEHFASNIRNIPESYTHVGGFTAPEIRRVVRLIDEIYEL